MIAGQDAIVVLDEGGEENLANLPTCCTTDNPLSLKSPQEGVCALPGQEAGNRINILPRDMRRSLRCLRGPVLLSFDIRPSLFIKCIC